MEDPNLGMATDFYFHTGVPMIPCTMNRGSPTACANIPHCQSKHDCDPGWAYECWANGTIHTYDPPSQSLFWNGTVPALICTLA